eukprot:364623-Chlamydomonas_euryale.AAC.1
MIAVSGSTVTQMSSHTASTLAWNMSAESKPASAVVVSGCAASEGPSSGRCLPPGQGRGLGADPGCGGPGVEAGHAAGRWHQQRLGGGRLGRHETERFRGACGHACQKSHIECGCASKSGCAIKCGCAIQQGHASIESSTSGSNCPPLWFHIPLQPANDSTGCTRNTNCRSAAVSIST